MYFRIAALTFGLFVLWLLMSGVYQPLIILFGALSCILCVWIVWRLEILDSKEMLGSLRLFPSIRYFFWLIVEIGKADWAVTKVILSKKLPKEQRLIAVPAHQKSDIGKTLFANSITITPGTITVETEENRLIVHALTDEAADMQALTDMGNSVSEIEKMYIKERDKA